MPSPRNLSEKRRNGGLERESPQNPLNSGLGIIVICPDRSNRSIQSISIVFFVPFIFSTFATLVTHRSINMIRLHCPFLSRSLANNLD